MFDFCNNLLEIPDISKWNIDKINIINMNSYFINDNSSLSLFYKDKCSFDSSSSDSKGYSSDNESLRNKSSDLSFPFVEDSKFYDDRDYNIINNIYDKFYD